MFAAHVFSLRYITHTLCVRTCCGLRRRKLCIALFFCGHVGGTVCPFDRRRGSSGDKRHGALAGEKPASKRLSGKSMRAWQASGGSGIKRRSVSRGMAMATVVTYGDINQRAGLAHQRAANTRAGVRRRQAVSNNGHQASLAWRGADDGAKNGGDAQISWTRSTLLARARALGIGSVRGVSSGNMAKTIDPPRISA